jgi:glyoxylase-like metal-dependent hydrolase (beta-lactamase superfamily II)
MKRTRITDQLTFLEPDDMRLFKACAGLMVESTRKLVIDTNMGPETTAFLQAENPQCAIITHYHLDHGTWGTLAQDHTRAEVVIPAGEERYLTDINYFLEQTAATYGPVDAWRHFSVEACGYRELERCSAYEAGRSFSDHRMPIICLDTAGHSPSHRSFYFPEAKVLFTGDMGVDRFGPWYGWVDCDLRHLVASILKLRELPVDVLLTSHGGMRTSNIGAVWDRALGLLLEREISVATRLENGLTPEAIVAEGIFFMQKSQVPEPMQSFLYMWDTAMFHHHRMLIEQGGLTRFFPELITLVPGSRNA